MKKLLYVLIPLLFISFLFDNPILNFFINNRNEILNTIIVWLTAWYILVLIAVIISIFIYVNKSKRKYIIPLWLSGIISYGLANLLKFIITRPRPDVMQLVQETSYSFPSSHATVVFSLLPILCIKFKKLMPLWITFGILIILTRLYVGVHYPSDIIAGSILGLIVGFIILKYTKQVTFLF